MAPNLIFVLISKGDMDAVKHALDDHAWLVQARNPNKDAWDELSPLHCAAKHGHLALVKLLVERGAEVYSNPMSTYPPVMIAAWNQRQPVVDHFLREIPDQAEGTNKLGVTIHLAARQGWADLVRKHIAADPLAVHQRGWIGDTPLHWPAHNGHVEVVEMLLDAGADIEADEINCYGGKPLHWASEHEPSTTELLLKRGAKVDSRNIKTDSDFHGQTALIMNARQKEDCAEVAELLIAAGADVNARDAKGNTALAYAVERQHPRVEAVLRRQGATA
jgi:ankyrin repeat protein